LPQKQGDSRCKSNAATLSAVHKKAQGDPVRRSAIVTRAATAMLRSRGNRNDGSDEPVGEAAGRNRPAAQGPALDRPPLRFEIAP
jgi:hypothetical protein